MVPILELEEELFCSVPCFFHTKRTERGDRADFFQLLPELFGKVGHFINRMDALPIEPSQHLDAPVSLFPERRDELFEFLGRQILKIDFF
jgi:hypothetical protein